MRLFSRKQLVLDRFQQFVRDCQLVLSLNQLHGYVVILLLQIDDSCVRFLQRNAHLHFERLFLLFEFLGHIRSHFLLLHFHVRFKRLNFVLRLVSHELHLFQQRSFG